MAEPGGPPFHRSRLRHGQDRRAGWRASGFRVRDAGRGDGLRDRAGPRLGGGTAQARHRRRGAPPALAHLWRRLFGAERQCARQRSSRRFYRDAGDTSRVQLAGAGAKAAPLPRLAAHLQRQQRIRLGRRLLSLDLQTVAGRPARALSRRRHCRLQSQGHRTGGADEAHGRQPLRASRPALPAAGRCAAILEGRGRFRLPRCEVRRRRRRRLRLAGRADRLGAQNHAVPADGRHDGDARRWPGLGQRLRGSLRQGDGDGCTDCP